MKIKKTFNNWKYLGFDRETYQKYAVDLAVSNLHILNTMLYIVVFCAVTLDIFLGFDSGDGLELTVASVVTVLSFLAMTVGFVMSKSSEPDPLKVNLLLTGLCVLLYACSMFFGLYRGSDRMSVTFVLLLVLLQVLFDLPPAFNAVVVPIEVIMIVLVILFKKQPSMAYDILHTVLATVVGMRLSYIKTKLKIDDIIANKQLQQSNYRLYHMSVTDELTGLDNRRLVFENLAALREQSRKTGIILGCIIMDIDSFKLYNDTYGHPAGDEVLKRLGGVLREFALENELYLGRIGGEEFLVLMEAETTDRVREAAERLRLLIRGLEIRHGKSKVDRYLTVSLGICTATEPWLLEGDNLYYYADKALYAAKNDTKNCIYEYNDGVYYRVIL